ncbi:MAG: exopolysaccharide biosynthesis polyprenyl glycosylphosphotransferase [Weeksellaceae bacterium]
MNTTMRNILTLCSYLFIILVTFSFANLIVNHQIWMDGRAYPSLLIISCIASVLSYFISNQNLINATTQIPQLLLKNLEYFFVFSLLVLIYWFSVNSVHYSKEHISIFILLSFIGILLFNYIYIRCLRTYKIGIPLVNSIVVGSNRFAKQFVNSLEYNDWMGFKLYKQIKPISFQDLDLNSYVEEHHIESVFINWDEFDLTEGREFQMRDLTEEKGVRFYAISEVFGTHLMPNAYNLAGNFPYIQLFTFPLDKALNAAAKRLFDVLFSLGFFIFIASWFFPIIIILLITNQGFPIFFSQKRHGIDNKEFDCYKFRTMKQNMECNDQITVKGDPRITKFGKLLRQTSLDELPQFWNVLKGDMSIVGPRPHMLNQNKYYNELISKYNFRHYVKPGITGLAQVNGFRGEIKTNKDMIDRVQADLYYIRNWSFKLDLSIIYRTIANMIRGDENAI